MPKALAHASDGGEKEVREELTRVEALGDGGGVAEDSAAEAAGDARRDGRAAHHHHLVGVGAGAVAAPRGGGAAVELPGRHGGGAGPAGGEAFCWGLRCFSLFPHRTTSVGESGQWSCAE
jgi:hypothetical protein